MIHAEPCLIIVYGVEYEGRAGQKKTAKHLAAAQALQALQNDQA